VLGLGGGGRCLGELRGSLDDDDGPGVVSVVIYRRVFGRVEGVAVVGERGGSEAERGVRRFEVGGGVGVLHRGHGVGENGGGGI